MKICIFGAGTIGSLLGGKLYKAGESVTLITRGAHLEAIRKNGLSIVGLDGKEESFPLTATQNPSDVGPQDAIILTAKSHDYSAAVSGILPLLGPNTILVTAMNGIPWWYFYKEGGDLDGTELKSVDPSRILQTKIDLNKVIGAVIWISAEMVSPGLIKHTSGNRFPIGEPSGEITTRVQDLAKAFERSGLECPVTEKIRFELWLKLWGNLAFNPMSILTKQTLEELAKDHQSKKIIRNMMTEAEKIAEKIGVQFPISVDERIQAAERVGPHQTSTLRDFQLGKYVELDSLLGAVLEIAELTGVEAPALNKIFKASVERAKEAGCYP